MTQLADAIGYDDRIGRKFLGAGLGFGGGCLPKDIRAFMARAGELGADQALTFLREVDAVNMRRRERVVDLAVQMLSATHATEAGASAPRGGKTTGPARPVLQGRRIAVLGANASAFDNAGTALEAGVARRPDPDAAASGS